MEIFDLTQPLGPRTVLWPGSPPFEATVTSQVDPGGHYARVVRTPEHAGTHLDAPAHFVAGGASAHEIPPASLVVQCAVVDVAAQCDGNPDCLVEAAHLRADEDRHGVLPVGGAVLVRTGWDVHAGDASAYLGGRDSSALRFPGLAADAAALVVERGCVGLGIDTLSVDRGASLDLPVHHTTLPAGLWHLEGLVGLDALPPRGALLFVGALRLQDGSGTPARVLAVTGL